MISDEELRAIVRVDINKIAQDYCLVFNIPKDKAETAIGPVMTAREMATELLQLREENARLTFLWNRVEGKNGYHEATEVQG